MEGEGTGRKNCKSLSLHGKVRLHPSAVRRRAGPVRKHDAQPTRPNAYTASARSRGKHASPILASDQGVAEANLLLRLGNGPLHFPQRHRHLQPNVHRQE